MSDVFEWEAIWRDQAGVWDGLLDE